MTIGIPYAREIVVDGRTVAVCPACDVGIVLEVRKDFESFTGIEYARHYELLHAPRAPEPPRGMSPQVAAVVAGLTPRQREIVDEHVGDWMKDEDDGSGLARISIRELDALMQSRYWEEEESDPSLAAEFAAIGAALAEASVR